MPIRSSLSPLAALAFAVLGLEPVPTLGQTPATALTPEESEAQQMGFQMAFACNPRRQRELQGSESSIRRSSDALTGTAVYSRTAEGTYLSLEQYDEALEGHCLVFGWFGGEYAPGRYAIVQLSMRAMEEEQSTGQRSFYAWGAVRSNGEMSTLMVRAGTLEVLAVEPGRVTGTFEVTGFLVEGADRTADVTWSGSFGAVEGE